MQSDEERLYIIHLKAAMIITGATNLVSVYNPCSQTVINHCQGEFIHLNSVRFIQWKHELSGYRNVRVVTIGNKCIYYFLQDVHCMYHFLKRNNVNKLTLFNNSWAFVANRLRLFNEFERGSISVSLEIFWTSSVPQRWNDYIIYNL